MTHAVTSTPDTHPHDDLDGLVALAAAVCGAGTKAVVNLLTTDLQVQLAAHGFTGSVSPRRDSMCAVVAHQADPVVVDDARLDPRFATNPWVTEGHVRFYASHQLRTAGGATLGSLCVFDDAPRTLDDDQQDQLARLARALSVVLEERLRIEALDAEVLQLRRERDELLRSNADLTTFGAYLAHDLLNPVTGLQLALEEARLELGGPQPDDRAVDQLLARATRSTSRVQAMIEALPAYARLGAQLHPELVDLAELLEEALEDLPEASRADLRCDDLPTVCGDRLHLRSLLQNVLSNSLKFNRGATLVIAVHAERTATGHLVEIADHGRGLDPADLADLDGVLEPAARGRNAAGVPGSGFGLSICRRVVEGHGGTFGLRETPGGGLTVWFELPDDPTAG